MFIAQSCGRVLVFDVASRTPSFFTRYSVELSLRVLDPFFTRAVTDFRYTQNEIDLFCVSLGFLLPILLTGESYSWRGHLNLPLSYTEPLVRWGLAVGYFPTFSADGDIRQNPELRIDLSTMSTRSFYEQFLLRYNTSGLAKAIVGQQECFQSGMESFKRFLHYRLTCFESCLPRPRWESPLAPGPYLDRAFEATLLGRMVGHNQLLFTGLSSDITRYYNELVVEGVPVAFWDAAGITLHHAGEEYFSNSYIQKILQ
uniref:P0 protein n=1 Tax=Cereal yellow dwarf virus (isolate RPV) TaxID=2170100 RepID=A0A220W0K7_BYDVN|nr:P0 protein [Cereal yellow dwarf virus RPV]